jgi:hypothetical protein
MAMAPFKPNQLMNRLPEDLAKFHLTFVTPEGIATFASHNARHLKMWWALQLAKLLTPERDHWCVLNRREFTPVKDVTTDLPVKRLPSCYFKGNTAIPQSADGTRHAFNSDAETGKRLPPMQSRGVRGFRMNPECDPLMLVEQQRRSSDERNCAALGEHIEWPQGRICPGRGVINRAWRIRALPA